MEAQIELLPSGIAQTVSHSIAPAFDTTKTYAKGDIVSYNGKIYKFTTAHAAGAWNASHVIEINAVDELISEATTLAGAAETAAKDASIAKTATYQTAESIYNAAVAQAGTNAGNTYIAKTSSYQTADAIVTEASRLSGVAETNAKSASIARTSTYQSADSIVTAAQTYTDNKLGAYSTTTQTATQISTYVTNNAYGKQSGVDITASSVKISSGSTYLLLSATGMMFSGQGASMNSTDSYYISVNGFGFAKMKNYQGVYYYSMDVINAGTGIDYFRITAFNSQTVLFSIGDIAFQPSNQTSKLLRIVYISGEEAICLKGNNVKLGNNDTTGNHILAIYADYIYWYQHCGQASSRDIKHNIREMEDVSEKISALCPVRFVYDADSTEEEQVGLIYEDTMDVIPEICFEANGEKAIDYIKLVPFLLKEVQRLQNEIKELRR